MEYFGREVKKDFNGVGVFTGRIVDFHRDTGYRVLYEDGDIEDLTEKELVLSIWLEPQLYCRCSPLSLCVVPIISQQKYLTKQKPTNGAPPQSMLSMRKDVSVTRDQYVKNARWAARRKRKHTELKRTGVLEVSKSARPSRRSCTGLSACIISDAGFELCK